MGLWDYGIIRTIYQSRWMVKNLMRWMASVDILVMMACVPCIPIRTNRRRVKIRSLVIMVVVAFELSEGYHLFSLTKELGGNRFFIKKVLGFGSSRRVSSLVGKMSVSKTDVVGSIPTSPAASYAADTYDVSPLKVII